MILRIEGLTRMIISRGHMKRNVKFTSASVLTKITKCARM